MQTKSSIWKIYGVVFALLAVAIALSISGGETPYQFKTEPVNMLLEGWETSSGETVNLPVVIPASVNKPVSISHVLGSDFNQEQVMCIRGSMQTVRVYLDGKPIYENLQSDRGFLNPPRVSVWNFIPIPENSAGKVVRIEFTIDMKSLTGHFGAVFYGNESALKDYILATFASDLPLVFIIFVFGVFFFFVPLVFREGKKTGFLYLGLFAMGIALWFFGEATLMQFISGNRWVLGGSGCVLLSLFGIPLIMYAKTAIAERTKWIFALLAMAFAANTLIVIVLQLFGVMQLYESLFLTHGLYAVTIVIAAASLIWEIRVANNIKALQFLNSLLPLLICALFEIISFYVMDFHRNPIFVKLGLLLFLCLQAVASINEIISLVKKSYAAEMYHKLAFEDRLTGGANRMAFDQAMEGIFSRITSFDNCRLIIFDLNSLKRINDTFGHRVGDQAIISGFKCIEIAFNNIGKCYRIGGDEFACICENCNDKLYVERMEALHELLDKESLELPYPLGIAAGSAVLNKVTDKTISDFMHRADMNMYENKLQYTVVSDLTKGDIS